jgi:hypothetical protein
MPDSPAKIINYLFILLLILSVLDFHVANLEYGNAATLDKVSLKNWDQVYGVKRDGKG